MLAPCRSRIRLSEMTVMCVGTVVLAVMPTHEALVYGQRVAGQVPYMVATVTELQWLSNERDNHSSLLFNAVNWANGEAAPNRANISFLIPPYTNTAGRDAPEWSRQTLSRDWTFSAMPRA